MPAFKLPFKSTVLALTFASFLLSGCGERPSSINRETSTRDGVLLMGNEGEVPTIDPHLNTSVNGSRVVNALIEGLIAYHLTDDNGAEPGVAESWTHKDNTLWTFKLRENAKWSNGDPVNAHDFTYGFERMLSPKLGARYAELLFVMKNAEAFNSGTIADFSQVGVKALDDFTLTIELNGPVPYFLNLLKHHAWFPVHRATIEKFGGIDKPDSNWIREEYIGNGPFQLEEWTMNKIIRVVPNPHYWDAETVKLKGIHFLPIDDISTEDKVFNSGGLHYQSTIPSDLISQYIKEKDPYLRTEPWIGTYFYRINTREPHLADKRVRQALSLSINRRAITKRIMKGGQAIALSITPPGMASYTPQPTAGFNPKRARELLAEAGYPNGEGFPKTTIIFNTSEQHKAVAESIQQMWQNILGIQIDIRNLEWKTYLANIDQADFSIARAAWIGDYVYPDTFLSLWQSNNGNNNTGWVNADYDRLLKESFVEPDSQRRLELLQEAETILADELPFIPIYFYNRIYRIDPAVKNWYPKLSDHRNYKFIELQSEDSN